MFAQKAFGISQERTDELADQFGEILRKILEKFEEDPSMEMELKPVWDEFVQLTKTENERLFAAFSFGASTVLLENGIREMQMYHMFENRFLSDITPQGEA